MPLNFSLYRCFSNEDLDGAIVKLERFVRSMAREPDTKRIADDYQRALDAARNERDRRVV